MACAFACCPPGIPEFSGGEDLLGWKLIEQIARYHDVCVLTRGDCKTGIDHYLTDNPVQGVHLHYIELPSLLKPLLKYQGGHQIYYYLWQVKAYFVARKLDQRHSYDLFHHITYANDWMVSFIGALLPIPYVRGPGGGAHYTPKSLTGEYSLSGRIWERIRSIGQWIFRHDPLFVKGHQRACSILVCNRNSEQILPHKWSHKVHFFPVSGVSTENFTRSKYPKESKNNFTVITAGALIRIKGFSLAIKAFKRFSDIYPESTLTIIGDGPEEPRLRNLIRTFELEDKVDLTGAIPHSDLMNKMAASDVLLFPSLRDGGGTVVIEAMSTGTPVICLNVGGPGLHVTEKCGIKIEPGSPSETVKNLSGALEKLYLDENLRESLGKFARVRAQESYHWDRLGERLMTIYQPIIGTRTDD